VPTLGEAIVVAEVEPGEYVLLFVGYNTGYREAIDKRSI